MAPRFSQQFCSVAPYTAGGTLVAGRKRQSCLVQVAGGELVIIEAPSSLVARHAAGFSRVARSVA